MCYWEKKKKTTTKKKKPHYRLSPASGAWITWQHISLAFHVNRRGLHSKWHRVMINMPVFVLLPTVSQHTGSCKFITSLFSLFLSLSPPEKSDLLKVDWIFSRSFWEGEGGIWGWATAELISHAFVFQVQSLQTKKWHIFFFFLSFFFFSVLTFCDVPPLPNEMNHS